MKLGSLEELASLKQQMDAQKSAKRFEAISLERIYSIEQPRTIFEKIDELAQSMKEVGQLQPIVVNPDGTGRFIIEQGERRYRAAKVAGLKVLYAVINDQGEKNADRIVRQLVENVQRENMKLFELVRAVHAVLNMGMTGRQLAARLGMHENEISALNSVSELPPVLDDLLVGMHIQDVKALRRLKSIHKDHPLEVEQQIAAWEHAYQAQPDEDKGERFVVTRAQVQLFDQSIKLKEKATVPVVTGSRAQDEAKDELHELQAEPRAESKKEHDPGHTSAEDFPVNEAELSDEDGRSANPQKNDGPQCDPGHTWTEEQQAAKCDIHVYAMNFGPGTIPLDRIPPSGKILVRLDANGETVELTPDKVRLIGVTARNVH